jgi:hypothetical protein
MFKPQWVRVTAPVYAASKGVALAAISAIFELMWAACAGLRLCPLLPWRTARTPLSNP